MKSLEKEEDQSSATKDSSSLQILEKVEEVSNEKPTTSQFSAIPQKRKIDSSSTQVKISMKEKNSNPYDYWMA